MDKRITDLEVRYMHLEKLVHELSDVVAEQQKAIDKLTLAVKAQSERLQGGTAPDEKPPHY